LSLSLDLGLDFVFLLIELLNPDACWEQLGIVRKVHSSPSRIDLLLEFLSLFLSDKLLLRLGFGTDNRITLLHERALHHALINCLQERGVLSFVHVYLERC
jgi:hypothetical protein